MLSRSAIVAGVVVLAVLGCREERPSKPTEEPTSWVEQGGWRKIGFGRPISGAGPEEAPEPSEAAVEPWSAGGAQILPALPPLLTGVVVDSADEPISGARVSFGFVGTEHTGADGSFAFEEIDYRFVTDPPESAFVVVEHPDYAHWSAQVRCNEPMRAILTSLPELSGELIAVDGQPLDDITHVTITIEGLGEDAERVSPVAADGTFRFGAVPVGVLASARLPGPARDSLRPVPRVALESGHALRVELEVESSIEIAARVIDVDSGEPLVGARVVEPTSGVVSRTDASGRCHFSPMGRQWFRTSDDPERTVVALEASLDGYHQVSGPVELAASDSFRHEVKVELRRSEVLVEGILLGADRSPRPGTEVYLTQARLEPLRQTTDSRGRFRFDAAAPFTARLQAWASEGEVNQCASRVVEPGKGAARVELVLGACGAVRGALEEKPGPAARTGVSASQSVNAHTGSRMSRVSVQTDETGAFSLEGLMPGPWELLPAFSTEEAVPTLIDVRAGETLDIGELRGGRLLIVHCRIDTGSYPARLLVLELHGPAGRVVRERSDPVRRTRGELRTWTTSLWARSDGPHRVVVLLGDELLFERIIDPKDVEELEIELP